MEQQSQKLTSLTDTPVFAVYECVISSLPLHSEQKLCMLELLALLPHFV